MKLLGQKHEDINKYKDIIWKQKTMKNKWEKCKNQLKLNKNKPLGKVSKNRNKNR